MWLIVGTATFSLGDEPVRFTVQTGKLRQAYGGVGAGTVFYEGHITSLAARKQNENQEQLYDDMFANVPCQYLQLMIRETHEPANDNADPYKPAFDDKNFEYCQHTLAICKAALKRRPEIELIATILTPPSWMKTNNDPSGGGEAKATLKDGLELEYAEYLWAFLEYMQRGGAPVQYLVIANEPDWPHTQPGCYFSGPKYAALLKNVAEYLDRMAQRYPDVPRPKLVGPNTLSAPGAAKDYLPLLAKGKLLDVIGAHDYDRRANRWESLRKLAGTRPVWMTEWCARDKDASPGLINSATSYGVAMHEAFAGGANAWLAYDWVYPPRDSGEALIHVDWGNGYRLTKPYHLFKQWATPLKPGMRVVETSPLGKPPKDAKSAVHPTAFLSAEDGLLVVHVVNPQDKPASVALKLSGKFAAATTAACSRTSAEEDAAELPELKVSAGTISDTLPARSMVTYRVELKK
jgi:glucosylceramidase